MAKACDFEGTNFVFQAPEGMDNCHDLPVAMRPDGSSISGWVLSEDELKQVMKTGVVWVRIWGRMPPISVHGQFHDDPGADPKPQPLNSVILDKRRKDES